MHSVRFTLSLVFIFFLSVTSHTQEVYFTTGFKIAEVSQNEVRIWTRLCAQEQPNPIVHERKEKVFRHPLNFDENMPVEQMDGAVKGAEGYVRAILKSGGEKRESKWVKVNAKDDFTAQIAFGELQPATRYDLMLEGKSSRNATNINKVEGTFTTPPEAETIVPVQFTTSTCQYFWSFDDKDKGFKTYQSMAEMHPDFFVQTGDYVYYDKPGPSANTIEKARHKWHAMDSRPSLKEFYTKTPIYMVKDDHDLLSDDVDPETEDYGKLSFEDGLKIWYENVAVEDKPYRTFRWGKDVQIWLVEGREFRTPNDVPDGPQKSIWGDTQKEWFQETLSQSDATFKILFSATPIVGPDREKKTDNHANQAFATEGNWLRSLLAKQENLFVVNGDRHWQYVSEDEVTSLVEFGSGPVSNEHVQGWDPNDKRPEHKYLNLIGGFLGVKVFREDEEVNIEFTHYDVDGNAVHQKRFQAK
ncbi:alkaline phosphatase D family protein [Catalinimonas niigatensis]|uniref:alkaline phosphatase D family protein n=1 Tax=Catalinimonas niigatensis TaxID=1397264 RepID=UPI002664E84F|nr:alkaline phosphatase D family protein [Catalinimonas niigatensis]WPP53026.1 alkaline phosphatase D family protein [Catalinimonas niigatensis]